MKVIIHLSSLGLTKPILAASLTKPILAAARTKPLSISSSSFQHEEEAEKKKIELRVCTNRVCRRQGSLESLQVLTGIAPPHVSVTACGCLGKCGAGPIVVVLPNPVFIKHCATPARAAETMSFVCLGRDCIDIESESNKCLEALALRERAEDEMDKANFSQAFHLLSQAIDLKPFGGLHISHRNRSVARLKMGDPAGALQDAEEALNIAPNYSDAYICQGDAFIAMDEIDAAKNSYSVALDVDPSISRSKSFKARIATLKEKLSPAI